MRRAIEVTPEKRVRVNEPSLIPRVLCRLLGRTAGDWVWDVSTGKGWMRRCDGKIAELTPRQVEVLRQAEIKAGPRGAQRVRELVLEMVSEEKKSADG